MAAPVTVGASAEKMYTAVMLQRDPQNVAYFPEPEEITSIKRMDTPSPTGGRPAPNIVFRDNVSIPDTTVPRGTVNVNTQDMRSGVRYAHLPWLVDANGTDAAQRAASGGGRRTECGGHTGRGGVFFCITDGSHMGEAGAKARH